MLRTLFPIALLCACTSDSEIRGPQEGSTLNLSEVAPLEEKWQTDTFVQVSEEKANVLFVIDNSISMDNDQIRLTEEMPLMIQLLHDAYVDYRIGFITTSSEDRLHTVADNRKWIDRTVEDPIKAFTDAAQVGLNGDSVEKGLYSWWLTTKNLENRDFFRRDVPLHTIFVTDEPDYTVWGEDISSKDEFWHQAHTNNTWHGRMTVTSIVMERDDTSCKGLWPTEINPQAYVDFTDKYPGIVVNICADSWTDAIETITADILDPRIIFTLTDIPVLETMQIYVKIDEVTQVRTPEDWFYTSDTNTITFKQNVPPEESRVLFTYQIAR